MSNIKNKIASVLLTMLMCTGLTSKQVNINAMRPPVIIHHVEFRPPPPPRRGPAINFPSESAPAVNCLIYTTVGLLTLGFFGAMIAGVAEAFSSDKPRKVKKIKPKVYINIDSVGSPAGEVYDPVTGYYWWWDGYQYTGWWDGYQYVPYY